VIIIDFENTILQRIKLETDKFRKQLIFNPKSVQ